MSAIIPVYNASDTILRALNSVSRQSYEPIEVIIVDDCSTDESVAIVEKAPVTNLTIIRSEMNSGPASARNLGLKSARGKYVAFLDADDEWFQDKTEKQVRLLERCPNATIASCFGRVIAPGHRVISDKHTAQTAPATGPEAWRTLLAYSFIRTSSVIARRDTLARLGGFDTRLLVAEDQDMWIRLSLSGEIAFVPEVLINFHVRTQSYMHKHAKREFDYVLPMIKKHVQDNRHRLSRAEIRYILGNRYSAVGRNLYLSDVLSGADLLIRSIAIGHNALADTFFLLHASPPGRLLKALRDHMLGRKA